MIRPSIRTMPIHTALGSIMPAQLRSTQHHVLLPVVKLLNNCCVPSEKTSGPEVLHTYTDLDSSDRRHRWGCKGAINTPTGADMSLGLSTTGLSPMNTATL